MENQAHSVSFFFFVIIMDHKSIRTCYFIFLPRILTN
jgi:hypothetical protein